MGARVTHTALDRVMPVRRKGLARSRALPCPSISADRTYAVGGQRFEIVTDVRRPEYAFSRDSRETAKGLSGRVVATCTRRSERGEAREGQTDLPNERRRARSAAFRINRVYPQGRRGTYPEMKRGGRGTGAVRRRPNHRDPDGSVPGAGGP